MFDAALIKPSLIYSHSIINKPSKPAWLKDLAVIDMGLYRRFYRQKRRSFAGAGDGAICGGATFSTSSSIAEHLTAVDTDLSSYTKRIAWFLDAAGHLRAKKTHDRANGPAPLRHQLCVRGPA